MYMKVSEQNIVPFDESRHIAIPGDEESTLQFCVEHFIQIANESIETHDHFNVALSGGSTPKAIYQRLALQENRNRVPWDKTSLFWSDERSVSPSDNESNYKMAMDNGFSLLPIPPENIFRMIAEDEIERNSQEYETLIKEKLANQRFDLVMLGMGPDGHTASLFPHTKGLHISDKLVIPNYIPQKKHGA